MVFQLLLIKARRLQLLAMFYIRELLCPVKDFHFMLFLLSAISILVTCKQCPVNEVQNQLEFEACGINRGYFNNYPDAFYGKSVDLEVVSTHSTEQHNLENICPLSNSFCFASTWTGFLLNDIGAESEASDTSGVQSKVFSSGLRQTKSNLSSSLNEGIFRFMGESSILCFFSLHGGSMEFSASVRSSKSDQQTDVFSCIIPLIDKNSHTSKSVENVHVDSVLSIYDPKNFAVGLHKHLAADTQKTETIVSCHFEGKIIAAFYLQLLRSPNNEAFAVMVPLETELRVGTASDIGRVSLSLKALPPCNTSGLIGDAVCLRNDAPYSLSTIKVSEIVAMDGKEAEELVLRNWKFQGTVTFMFVLFENMLLFPVVLVMNYCSQWMAVRNLSHEPFAMQLILNPGEVIGKCQMAEMLSQPPSSNILLGKKSIAPTRCGFSTAKDALTEALIHPYGSATFGPILFQPSNRCEWKSSALTRNDISGVGFGGSNSFALLEGNDLVLSLEFKFNLPAWPKCSSPDTSQSMGGKTPYCCQPLTKEVYVKDMEGLPLDVIQIEVSRAEYGLGFVIHNCKGFALQSREPVMLLISYQSDFSAATIWRDLELALASGLIVIPMKASIPLSMHNFFKGPFFWVWLEDVMLLIFLAASLLVSLLFLHISAFACQDIKSGKNALSSVIVTLNSLYAHVNWKNDGAMSFQMNEFLESTAPEEALEPASRDPEGVLVNSSTAHQKQTNSLLEVEGDSNSVSAALSRPSAENLNVQYSSQNLRVRIGKEKRRRRKRKKSSGPGVSIFEVSSSQSGNSTSSSPLSPAASTTPKQSRPVSPGTRQRVEAGNTFSRVPSGKGKCSAKDSLLNQDFPLGQGKNNSCTCSRSGLTRREAGTGRASLLPSATFPGAAATDSPPWTSCPSPFLASTSTMDPRVRAPGTKLIRRQKAGGREEKVDVRQTFTYDIWGDHLFRPPLTYQSEGVCSTPSAIENGSESFFVWGPETLVTNSLLQPIGIPDLKGNE